MPRLILLGLLLVSIGATGAMAQRISGRTGSGGVVSSGFLTQVNGFYILQLNGSKLRVQR